MVVYYTTGERRKCFSMYSYLSFIVRFCRYNRTDSDYHISNEMLQEIAHAQDINPKMW